MAGKKKIKKEDPIIETEMENVDPEGSNGVRILAELGALKLSNILYKKVNDAIWEKFEFVLLRDIDEYDVSKAEYDALIDYNNNGFEAGRRLLNLRGCCTSNVVLTLLELIALKISVPGITELYDVIAPGNGRGVTLLTAARASGYLETMDEALLPMWEAYAPAEFLFERLSSDAPVFFLDQYFADAYLISFLCAGKKEGLPYEEFIFRLDDSDDEPEIYGMDEVKDGLYESMKKMLSDRESSFSVLISGEKESGRYTLIKSVSKKLGLSLITVDFDFLLNEKDPKDAMRYIVRCCALEGRALCVRNIVKNDDTEFLIDRLRDLYRKHSGLPFILLSDRTVKLAPKLSEQFISITMPDSAVLSSALWTGYLPEEYRHLAGSLSSKMKLNAGQLKKVSLAIDALLRAGKDVDEHSIIKLCYEILDDGRYDNVKWVRPGFKLEDLKIDDHNRSVLNDIINQVEHRFKVYDEWSLKEKYAYGRCVSVILAGPPGTGKTMTVHALASRLGLELYKVDLSQITDKYVGETEKRLEEVFTRAERCNMILFFDEADAVMGKRSDVKDAQDKYANTEISFILQRLEEFDGIVILATNNMQNIDTAFMRRIRYVLNFERPDEATRRGIWQGAFSDDVPLDDDIDIDYLAKQFELSGGEIKNVVLNAVFYGASEDGKGGMKHIMKAIFRELTKTRRVTLNEDYGKYGYLMKD